MRNFAWLAVLAVAVPACGGTDSATQPDAGLPPLSPVQFAFPDIGVKSGEELPWLCQSITLGNREPIYVNAVTMSAGPAWHHSNWFFVPDSKYEGPDGTWDCSDREFDQIEAGVAGGVLFAQSTQATSEVQQFVPGAAVIIPPYSRVVGQVHLLNASDQDLSTSITLDIKQVRSAEVDTVLAPLVLQYLPLRIPPLQRSSFVTECDFQRVNGEPVDFNIHYVLPHYHDIGEGIVLETIDGPRDGEAIFKRDSPIGEPLGGSLDPLYALGGAKGIRFGCNFDNHRDQTVRWGIGDREMCALLAFTDAPVAWVGGVDSVSTRIDDDEDGVAQFRGECSVVGLPLRY